MTVERAVRAPIRFDAGKRLFVLSSTSMLKRQSRSVLHTWSGPVDLLRHQQRFAMIWPNWNRMDTFRSRT